MKVLGVSFGVQVYRQLSIAITERHVRQISKPFDRYCDKGREKDLEVPFAWQSGHRPLLRGTIYGLDAAFPDSLQPSLLRIYEWASSEWHHFLQGDIAAEAPSPTVLSLDEVHSTTVETRYDEDHSCLKRKAPSSNDSHSPPLKRPCLHSNETLPNEQKTVDAIHTIREQDDGYRRNDTSSLVALVQSRKFRTDAVRTSACGRIAYIADYKVVICIPCGHCIKPPPCAKRHFKSMHPDWSQKARRDLVNQIDEICLVAPESLRYARCSVPAVAYLPIYDGWSCRQCEYFCVSEVAVTEHAKKEHGWVKRHGKIWRGAQVQTFFSGAHRRFFEVQGDT